MCVWGGVWLRVRVCMCVGVWVCGCVGVCIGHAFTPLHRCLVPLAFAFCHCNTLSPQVSASLSNVECMHLIFTALLEALTLHHSISLPRNSHVKLENVKLNQLDTNQGPSACRVDVLPLGHGLAVSHRMETCDFPHLACTCW